MFLVSCASYKNLGPIDSHYQQYYKKVCIEGSGKGRLEFLSHKYPFEYESQIDRTNNVFNLAFDFPIIGEKKITLNLDPNLTKKGINYFQIAQMVEPQIKDRQDKEAIIDSLQAFFILTSEFVQFKATNTIPSHYKMLMRDDHFLMNLERGANLFEIDAFAQGEKYFERVILKIFPQNKLTQAPIISLYLVPGECDQK